MEVGGSSESLVGCAMAPIAGSLIIGVINGPTPCPIVMSVAFSGAWIATRVCAGSGPSGRERLLKAKVIKLCFLDSPCGDRLARTVSMDRKKRKREHNILIGEWWKVNNG